MSSAAVPPESFVPDFQTNTPPPVTTPPTAVGDTAIPSSTSQSTPTAPPNTTDTTSLPQSQIGKSTAAPSTQNSTRTHSETGDGPSTTTWTLTEHLAANAFTSANSPSEVLVIVSTTVTQLPATSMTTMTTQVVTQTSIVTRHNPDTTVIAGSVVGAIAVLSILISAFLLLRKYLQSRSQRRTSSDDTSSFRTPLRPSSWFAFGEKPQDEGEDVHGESYTYPTPTTGGIFESDHQESLTDGDRRMSHVDERSNGAIGQFPRLEPLRRHPESVSMSVYSSYNQNGDDSSSFAGIADPPPAYIP